MTQSTPALPAPSPLSPADERTWAMLAHLSVLVNLITGFLGPVAAFVIYLVYKDRSRYVAYHSMQSLLLQLIVWIGGGTLAGIAWAITGLLSSVIVGICLIPFACLVSALPLAAPVFGVIAGVQCSQGNDYRYWLIGDWTRHILEG
ncbi:MAG: DUF4870 domain-containing protein [Anaerolineaceae bacterium]|nr:DUF4870 domain-containing protein [Anaerolineaceae bacterium]